MELVAKRFATMKRTINVASAPRAIPLIAIFILAWVPLVSPSDRTDTCQRYLC